jgi:hypothetical protein
MIRRKRKMYKRRRFVAVIDGEFSASITDDQVKQSILFELWMLTKPGSRAKVEVKEEPDGGDQKDGGSTA